MPDSAAILPEDGYTGTLVGRLWLDGECAGPIPVAVRQDGLFDLSALAPTMSDLCDLDDPASAVAAHDGRHVCTLDQAIEDDRLLAPCDLQAVKAAGVTFAASLVERVIEERAKGDPQAAKALRVELAEIFDGEIMSIEPGSPAAAEAKDLLIERGLWSQYLEVGIGPDAEIFTKAQPMSAVGYGAEIGLHPRSEWNNPEPEVVLAVASTGRIVGATLGNDVNLRDFEGRSALLLSKAKDNNASCAIGPFLRLFDDGFSLDDVKQAEVRLVVEGPDDGFRVEGVNAMAEISRPPEALVAATIGPNHQYPDGLMLFLGTMFVPTADRAGPGQGFTHRIGDTVRISSPKLGTLQNTIGLSPDIAPWTFGTRALMRSLAKRGLL